jgi:hypothetical protein
MLRGDQASHLHTLSPGVEWGRCEGTACLTDPLIEAVGGVAVQEAARVLVLEAHLRALEPVLDKTQVRGRGGASVSLPRTHPTSGFQCHLMARTRWMMSCLEVTLRGIAACVRYQALHSPRPCTAHPSRRPCPPSRSPRSSSPPAKPRPHQHQPFPSPRRLHSLAYILQARARHVGTNCCAH